MFATACTNTSEHSLTSSITSWICAIDVLYSFVACTKSSNCVFMSFCINAIILSKHSCTLAIFSFVFTQIAWISFTVCEELFAKLPISPATTAKPFPASPALAASMDAFNDNRFVWLVMSKICFAISSICVRDCRLTIASCIALWFSSILIFVLLKDALASSRISKTLSISSVLFVLPILILDSTCETTVATSPIFSSTCATVLLTWTIRFENCSVAVAFSSTHRINISEDSVIFTAESFKESEHIPSVPIISLKESLNESNAVAICPISLLQPMYFLNLSSL